jgi:hypothetical protein
MQFFFVNLMFVSCVWWIERGGFRWQEIELKEKQGCHFVFECESFRGVTSMNSSKFSMRKTKVGPMLDARFKDKSKFKALYCRRKRLFWGKFSYFVDNITKEEYFIINYLKNKITNYIYIKQINLNHHDCLQYEKVLKIFYFWYFEYSQIWLKSHGWTQLEQQHKIGQIIF